MKKTTVMTKQARDSDDRVLRTLYREDVSTTTLLEDFRLAPIRYRMALVLLCTAAPIGAAALVAGSVLRLVEGALFMGLPVLFLLLILQHFTKSVRKTESSSFGLKPDGRCYHWSKTDRQPTLEDFPTSAHSSNWKPIEITRLSKSVRSEIARTNPEFLLLD